MRVLVLLVVGVFAAYAKPAYATENCTPSIAADLTPKVPPWLAGEWVEETTGAPARQYWSGPYHGTLLGHEIVSTGRVTSFAFLRIARTSHGIALFVSPDGSPAIELTAVEICSDRMVFEGDGSGYAHRIVYLRDAKLTPNSITQGGRTFSRRIPHSLFL